MISFRDIQALEQALNLENERVLKVLTTTVRSSITELGTLITETTPVGKGWAKGSWRVGFGTPPKDGSALDPSGATSVKLIKNAMDNWRPGTAIFIGNVARNKDGDIYIYFVEFGTSRMPPRGFVRRAVSKFPAIFEANIARAEATSGR